MPTDIEKAVEEIQSKLDIAEVIAGYIPLKRAGRNFKANCPFHHEKTPSFVISPGKQIFHCFGCAAGGDMITFVMKYERVEFMEALRILASKAGVSLPQFKGGISARKSSFTGALYRVNEMAANYYSALLVASSKAKEARKYLADRSLNAATVAKFKLGFAPEEWEGFIKFAKEKGVSNATLEKAGLAIPGREGSFYDRFRNRIIFPIFDIRSKIVAFGGRVIDDSQPKYMNSPETDIYVKGRHLYGFNLALDEIKKKDYVIIVEGYLDLIIPYQNGVTNIAATLGTALTVEQIRLIKRFTNNAVIIFDADEAGEAASLRGLDLFVSEGLYVKIARLPEGLDPDTYVRKNSSESFLKLVESADNLFDYKLGLLLKRFDPDTVEEKAKITSEMLPTIKRVENAVLRSDYVRKLSESLFINEDAILEELSKVKLDYSYLGDNRVLRDRVAIRPAEKIIVGLMIEDPEIAQEVRSKLRIEYFQSEDVRSILRAIAQMLDEGKIPTAAKIIHQLDDDNLSHIICETLTETENFVDRERCLHDCILRIKQDELKLKREKITTLIKEAEQRGDEIRLMNLVKELDTLRSVKL
ncbi:MAG: DNA primase [Candidatus Omnitrophota bacterium]